uniref:cAMP-responsive element modulator-like isoform X4 n=1 Tax=Oncorhynchus gorbuscha TaxID=8017 RepID=UPI001EAF4B36|nr:cAMP-responsive element modulator-like isoform X4 [Oncorhynchus gorbuscha]
MGVTGTIIMASNACQMQEQGSGGSLSSLAQVATRRAKSEDRNSNEDVSNAHNRRELPSRRQAYRKVSSDPAGPKVEEIKEEVAPCSVPPGPGMPASIYQTNHGQFIAFTQDGAIQLTSALPRGLQALQPLTMSNSGNSQSAAAIVQYSQQSGDGTQQFYMQGNKGMVKGQAIFCSPTPPQDQVPLLGGSGILLDRPKPLECTPGPPESTTDSGLLFKTGLKTFLF